MQLFKLRQKKDAPDSGQMFRQPSSEAKNQNKFVDPLQTQLIRQMSDPENLGLEYNKDVNSDKDYYKKIFETNTYKTQALASSMPKKNALSDITNANQNIMSAWNSGPGVLMPNPQNTNGLPETTFEASLKQYLLRKLGDRKNFSQERFYTLKIKWLTKIAMLQRQENKFNLNNLRLTLEKIIELASPTLAVPSLQSHKKVRKSLKKLSNFMVKLEPQKAILLSYKLFKMHLKQLDLEDPESQKEVATSFHNIYIPYLRLMELKKGFIRKRVQAKRTNLVTYKKIKKLSESPDMAQILTKYEDPKRSAEYLVHLREKLEKRVSFEQAFTELSMRTREVLHGVPQFSLDKSPLTSNNSVETPSSLEELDNVPVGMKESTDDMHYENARSLDLDEHPHALGVGGFTNYGFSDKLTDRNRSKLASKAFEKSESLRKDLLKGKIACPRHLESSDESLSEDGTGSGDEKEVLEDSALYDAGENPREIITNQKTKPPSIFKFEASQYNNDKIMPSETFTSPPKLFPIIEDTSNQRRSFNRLSSGKAPTMTSEDVHLTVDPLRVSHRLELVKVNSSNNLQTPIRDKEAESNEFGMGEPVVRSQQRLSTSIFQRSSKKKNTKKEMVFQKVLSLAYDTTSKWEKVIDNSVVKIEKIKPENSPVLLIRAWATIEGFTPKEIFDQIYDTEARSKWDTVTLDLHVIEKLDENSEMIYFYVKTPFGITERDFTQKRDYALDFPQPGHIVMSFQSCTHPAMPPKKNRIRGETHIAGYLMKPSDTKPNSTDFCILSQVDIKGKVPTTIVNMVAAKAPAEWLNKMKKACERARANSKHYNK